MTANKEGKKNGDSLTQSSGSSLPDRKSNPCVCCQQVDQEISPGLPCAGSSQQLPKQNTNKNQLTRNTGLDQSGF
jgi:hypothetical protein